MSTTSSESTRKTDFLGGGGHKHILVDGELANMGTVNNENQLYFVPEGM